MPKTIIEILELSAHQEKHCLYPSCNLELSWKDNRSGYCAKHGRTAEARKVLSNLNYRWSTLEQKYWSFGCNGYIRTWLDSSETICFRRVWGGFKICF